MMLPYSLDQIPTLLGKALLRLTRRTVVGRRVELRVTEGNPRHFGTVLLGRLQENVLSDDVSGVEGALVHLDRPWSFEGSDATGPTTLVLVSPRFAGHTIERLLITSSHVNVAAIGAQQARWPAPVPAGICEMRLSRP